MDKSLLILFSLLIGISSIALGDCEFNKPETVIGKADVIRVVNFSVPKKNKCFPNRGDQLGKIQFQYEFPEGSYNYYQVVVYFDSATQCYNNNGNVVKCSDIRKGAEIGDVRYFEKDVRGKKKIGVLNRLFFIQ